jgi:hypothetical protein
VTVHLPAEVHEAMEQLLATLDAHGFPCRVQSGQVVFDFNESRLAGVRPQPVFRFAQNPVANNDQHAHTRRRT